VFTVFGTFLALSMVSYNRKLIYMWWFQTLKYQLYHIRCSVHTADAGYLW